MKIIFLSDLHLNKLFQNNSYTMQDFFDYFCELEIEIILINGDFSTNFDDIYYFQKIIESSSHIRVIATPGNHEISMDDKLLNPVNFAHFKKDKIYDHFSIDKAYQINDKWAILPCYGFFDLSYFTFLSVKELIPYAFYQCKEILPILLEPKRSLSFLEKQILIWEQEIAKFPKHNFIFAQHFVPDYFFASLPESPLNQIRIRMLGSNKLEEFIQRNPRIKLVHFGHNHYAYFNELFKGVHHIASPFGNFNEWNVDFSTQLLNSSFIFDTEKNEIIHKGISKNIIL